MPPPEAGVKQRGCAREQVRRLAAASLFALAWLCQSFKSRPDGWRMLMVWMLAQERSHKVKLSRMKAAGLYKKQAGKSHACHVIR